MRPFRKFGFIDGHPDPRRGPEAPARSARRIPPAESPMAMSTQALQDFPGQTGSRIRDRRPFRCGGPASWSALRALTSAGCYEMYDVLKVGGVTTLEAMVLGLFVLLFAWIAFSFMSNLAGFFVLLFRKSDPLGIDPTAPLPSIRSTECDVAADLQRRPLSDHGAASRHLGVGGGNRIRSAFRLVYPERHDRSLRSGSPRKNVSCSSRATSATGFSIATARKIPRGNPAISRTGSSGSAPATTT